MHHLKVTLFGSVQVSLQPENPNIHLTRTIQALFAYLLLGRSRTFPRDVLANLFWGDSSEEHARGCLNTALWRLRQAIEPAGSPPEKFLLINNQGEVGFNSLSSYWLDVAEFEQKAGQLMDCPIEKIELDHVQAFEQVLPLYQGDVLEGFYDDWALRERERLRFLYLNSLAALMGFYHAQRSFEKSLVYGQRILAIDPLREEIHREMIRLYAECGQRVLAMRQYEFCRKALSEEMGIHPMPETEALYQQIATHSIPPTGTVISYNSNGTRKQSLNDLLTQLEQTQQVINSAQEQLYQIVQAVKDLVTKGE